jgi:diguanylate cyclase (GGDEF)-like protein
MRRAGRAPGESLERLSEDKIGDDVRFRIASIRVAVALSLAAAVGVQGYALATWDRPHRALLSILVVFAMVLVASIELLPTERIVRSRWREVFFAGWSIALVALIAIGAGLDGGPESPLVLLFVLPLIFAALSYPPLGVLVVGGIDLFAFGIVAVVEPAAAPQSLFIAFALLCATMMCGWQARNRKLREEQLGAMTGALAHSESIARLRALQQQEVAAFGQRALAGAPVRRLMQDVVSTLTRVFGVDFAAVLELDADGEELVMRAGVGLPEELVVPAGRGSQSGYTLESGHAVVVNDWATETRFEAPEIAHKLLVSSGATVLITVGGRPFGILGVWSRPRHRFGRDELNFIQAMANALASAIERCTEEEDAQHRALHDSLTGLPNRALFEDRLDRALAEQERRGSSVAVIFLDIDHFKLVNDSLGHHAGDELLTAIAPRLKQALRPGDTVARFGGDEFGVLLEDVSNERDATRVAERIAGALARPFVVDGREHFVTVSAGIALGRAADLPATLIRDSDAAMYRAKERGRARYEIFDEMMRVRIAHRLQIENELRSAIDRSELRVHYQPVVSLATGRITGVEALARWQHPQHGLMQPADFIPIAEESGLITALGRWVLEQACSQTSGWHRANADEAPIGISVNMSVRQLGDHHQLTEFVRRTLEVTGLDPASLSLELTEGALIDEAETAAAALRDLKGLGIRLVLDDFGTGYSSLASLQRLPFDSIKLDKTFVSRLGQDRVDHAIVTAVVALAQSLDLTVIAEGVETAEQLAIVKALGCHHAQGFYFSRPIVPEELGPLLGTRAPLSGKPV